MRAASPGKYVTVTLGEACLRSLGLFRSRGNRRPRSFLVRTSGGIEEIYPSKGKFRSKLKVLDRACQAARNALRTTRRLVSASDHRSRVSLGPRAASLR